MDKKGLVVTNVSLKTYLILVVLAIVFIIAYFYLFIPYKISEATGDTNNKFPSKERFNLEVCPVEFNTGKYYGSIGSFYVENEMYDGLSNFLKKQRALYFATLIDEDRQINGEQKGELGLFCTGATKEGENENYYYCGGKYITPRTTNSEGVILPQKKYELRLIVDIRTCELGEFKKNKGYEFECDFVEVGCKEITS